MNGRGCLANVGFNVHTVRNQIQKEHSRHDDRSERSELSQRENACNRWQVQFMPPNKDTVAPSNV